MANNGVTMKVSYSSFKGYESDDGEDVMSIELSFPRLVSRGAVAKLVADFANSNVDFTFTSNGSGYDKKGPEIRFGWYSPPVNELIPMLTSHGFGVRRDFVVYDNHKDVTKEVKLGTYDPNAPETKKEEAQA